MTSRNRAPLSSNFAAAEFDCHDGTPWPPAARDALALWCAAWGEPMREAFGPIRVTSGFRTPTYNRSVGGAPASFHVYTLRYGVTPHGAGGVGVAADVVPARGTTAQWQAWASARIGRRLGKKLTGRGAAVAYPRSGFIHLDTGPTRTWAG